MLPDLSDTDCAERDSIIAELYAAFDGVTLGEHGISWRESEAIEDCKSAETRRAARDAET